MGYFDFRFSKSRDAKNGIPGIGNMGRKSLLDFFAEDDIVEYGKGGGPSQNMVVMMPVDEYVALCEPLKADDHKHHADLKGKVESGEIRKFDTIPLLRIRQMEDGSDAKVYGHDGRHRALLMKEYGFKEIPVRLYAENFCWGDDDVDEETEKLHGWPKWLWGQNDKGMDTDKEKFKFPVMREDSGKAFDRTLLDATRSAKAIAGDERVTVAKTEVMDGGKKVYRDELGRLIGTAQMECGVLVFRDHMGRRVASAMFE